MAGYQLQTAYVLLRISLAFALAFAAVSGFLMPDAWVGYFPTFGSGFISLKQALLVWSVLEIILAAWIVTGVAVHIPAAITAVALFLMVAFNLPQITILFRDVSLAFAALALVGMRQVVAYTEGEHDTM